MNLKDKPSTFTNELQQNSSMNNQSFATFGSQLQHKWKDPSLIDYSTRIETSFSKFSQPSENSPLFSSDPNFQSKTTSQDWDPRATLNNLTFLKQKIHQLQEVVHMIAGERDRVPGNQGELVLQQQQLITADLTSIIVELISAAGSLLPSVNKSSFSAANPSALQPDRVLYPSATTAGTGLMSQGTSEQPKQCVAPVKSLDQSNQIDLRHSSGTEQNCHSMEEDHELKDEEDGKEEEHLPPGSYEILQLEKEEILAPHTHFCTICGKGFKRDANLRMHMRGHGDEYKTPTALAKPNKESSSEQVLLKRYSCPFTGCKRNKEHKKFQPLKTILCVKNHYKRTHCDKSYICSRCHVKKFSVIADLKTHEKHCGRDKWMCSCGTTFSRKDKLFGHIALFQGHTPAIPWEDTKGAAGQSHAIENSETANIVANVGYSFGSNVASSTSFESMMDVKGNTEDPYFPLLNYEGSLSGLQDFTIPGFDDSVTSFSFLISCERNGMLSGTNDID